MSERKAVIKNADMSEEMQQDAVDCATQALEKYNIEKDIAAYIKKEFDKKYNPTWHCIVGRNFGSYVTHETKHFIYFYLGQVAILLFKSGWKLDTVYHLSLRLQNNQQSLYSLICYLYVFMATISWLMALFAVFHGCDSCYWLWMQHVKQSFRLDIIKQIHELIYLSNLL